MSKGGLRWNLHWTPMLVPGTKGVKTEAELVQRLLDEGLRQPPCPCFSGPSSLPMPTAAYRAATCFPNTMIFLLQSQSSCSVIKKSPLDAALIQSQGRCVARLVQESDHRALRVPSVAKPPALSFSSPSNLPTSSALQAQLMPLPKKLLDRTCLTAANAFRITKVAFEKDGT